MFDIGRRKFMKLLGGATAWPRAARAQSDRMRRIGMLMAYNDSDSEAQVFVRTFVQGLAELGWIDGRNVQMDLRWAAGEVERMRAGKGAGCHQSRRNRLQHHAGDRRVPS